MLRQSKFGVLLSIKDSSIIHLYDAQTFECKLLFDLRLNIKLNIKIDDDFSFSKSRLTCYLSFEDLVLVGTGDGFLYIYTIERYMRKKIDKVHKKFSLITPVLRNNRTKRKFSIGPQLLEKNLENKNNQDRIRRNSSFPSILNKTNGLNLKKTKSFNLLKSAISKNEIENFYHYWETMKKNENQKYDFNINLVNKVKISDQPVKCILRKKYVL